MIIATQRKKVVTLYRISNISVGVTLQVLLILSLLHYLNLPVPPLPALDVPEMVKVTGEMTLTYRIA